MNIINEVFELMELFPGSFINRRCELILETKHNVYFGLKEINSVLILKCKLIEWVSRPAHKCTTKKCKELCLNGINNFLGQSFDYNDISEIYAYLGNTVNRDKTIKFIKSNYDMSILKD